MGTGEGEGGGKKTSVVVKVLIHKGKHSDLLKLKLLKVQIKKVSHIKTRVQIRMK